MERLAHEVTDDAWAAEKHLPSWLRPGAPESRIPVLIALIAAVGLPLAIPAQFTVTPRWPLPVLESALLLILAILDPIKFTRSTTLGRWATYLLISAVLLDDKIVSGQIGDNPRVMLGSGLAIFITNVIVCGMRYWEFDRSGPFARHTLERPQPDFRFPQMANLKLAPPDWHPKFPDYLYVSFTNVVAFCPTDTMLAYRWAKMLMALLSMVAFSTVALVLARAVNILSWP